MVRHFVGVGFGRRALRKTLVSVPEVPPEERLELRHIILWLTDQPASHLRLVPVSPQRSIPAIPNLYQGLIVVYTSV